ncbi:alpha/beta fold hydrolase [Mammaliicoccus sciuri]|uniref:alpha/beta fold hydrolase n=1 Tax=Mammaliicoccus sciuri TaxID=1296 RepID=UPI000734AA9A|nr:alpha/beta hydrolase [Mammaliicoccus sciuri]KTT81055.1 lysophospholipase [Mammaliicoccus sciuri]MBA1396371.1 alpha/beta fold hydrolase [Mammaliicoccus sciuri]MCJ0953751.1 alpha/beta hydrolase [Mammaliicoccus sciuri]MEB8206396.1 alpha/beta hydrolase [Mammaliicoccus sciuri]
MNYKHQIAWKKIESKLPEKFHFTEEYQPNEEWWDWKGHHVHLDTFRNENADVKIILLHGVGTNGRQLSLIAGGPLAKKNYETIAIDMPTYGMTQVKKGEIVTYDDWVNLASDYIDEESKKDARPIFLYGLSAGGMETFHVAAKNKKVNGIIGMTFLDQRKQMIRDATAHDILMSRIGIPAAGLMRKIGLGFIKIPMKIVSKMYTLVNNDTILKIMLDDKSSAGNLATMTFLDSYGNYKPEVEPEMFDTCPVLLTQPSLDRWTPKYLSVPFLFELKKVEHEIIDLENGGHYPVEQPALDELVEAIDNFIKKYK